MNHSHWQIYAYNKVLDNGQLEGAVMVEVIDQPIESVAIEQAKKIVQRPYYVLQKVFECKTCSTIEEQKKMIEEARKMMKGE